MIHQTSKLYALFKRYVKFTHRLFYKKIYVSGLENIPVGDPVIFGPNHQNALMDPLAVLLTTPLQPVFLARADIFKSSINRPVLRFLKILPVYRVRDGIKSLGNNDSTFNESIGVLEAKKQLALFPEARHHGQNFLLPLKKGIPRIALMAEEKHNFNLNLKIVPVGIHYSNYFGFKADIWVNYGKPILVDELKTSYAENPQQTHIILRDKIAEGIKPLMLNIEDTERYNETELLLNLEETVQNKKHTRDYLRSAQTFIRNLSDLSTEKKDTLLSDANLLLEKLKNLSLGPSDLSVSNKPRFLTYLELILGLPLCIAGYLPTRLFTVPPWFLYRNLKDRQFESSYKYMFMLLGAPVSYALFAFVISPLILSSDIWISILVFFALFFIGSYTLRYLNLLKTTWRYFLISRKITVLKVDINNLKSQLKISLSERQE
ncbi:1-acyl-sn-glycerol-3-phosphate acyltransferase [Saccharicrinis sp. FJH2]|uniref:1-acyl-sn-glycerol-3-phosphate acyltransferase n=1 Tax=Saccharicrinis sp. FJH65 TaxID=3344659 RepID=UPI0035F34DE8